MDSALKRSKSYSSTKHYIAIADLLLTIGFLTVLQASGLSGFLAKSLYGALKSPYLALMLYVAAIGLSLNILSFPLDFLSSFRLEHKFGLSRQGLGSWLKDYAKKIIIAGLIYFAFILLIYYFLAASTLWWLYTALVYFLFSVVLARVFPVLIIPLFYRLSEISDTALKSRIVSLAKDCGVRVLNVYNIGLGQKTKKANAAVCGLGSTKRILLSDTLLHEYSADEIEATLGHELAHHKYHHFWKMNLFSFLVTLLGFLAVDSCVRRAVTSGYIMRADDVSFFPVLAAVFILYNVLAAPFMNYISRVYEREADREAVLITKKPQALADLMRKLTVQNLSDPQPNKIIKFFFYDHPPALERIKACEAFGQTSGKK